MSRFWKKQRNRIVYLDDGFSPHSIPGLAQWLDASDASTMTFDGSGNIEQWRDKSGNGRHSGQSNTTLRPSYPLNVQNGMPGVLIDSTDDFLTSYANVVNPCTWFLVHRWNGSTRDTRFVSNQAANGLAIGLSASSGNNLSFVREGVAWTNSGFSPGNGTNRIYRVSFASGTASFWTWSGGVETLRQTTTLTGTIGTPSGFSFPGHHFDRFLYEGTPTTDQANALYAYISAKWNIP